MGKISLKIITPEKIVHESMVDQVTLPTEDGEITILPNHVSLITTLGKGDVVALVDGHIFPYIAVGGIVRVRDNEVAVLADFAEHVETIATTEAISLAQERAKELAKLFENSSDVDFEHFQTELERSLTKIKIGEKWRMRKYRK